MYGCSNATASAARGGPSSSKQNNFREQQQTPLPPLCSNSDQQLNSRKPSNIEQGSSVSIMKMDSAVSLSDRKLTMTVKEWHDLCESSIAEHVEKLRVQFTSQCRKIADRIEQLEKSTISSRRSRRAKKSSKAEISKAQAVKPQLDEIKKDWDATQSILNPNRKIQIPLTTTTDSTHSTQQLLDGNSTSITREFELHEQHKTVMKAVMANSWKAYFCPEETKGLQKIKKSVRWPEKVISDIYTWVEGEDEPEEEDEMLSEDDLRTTTSPSECVNLSISEITAATQTARLHAPYTTLADDEDPEECYLADDETSTRFLTSSNITILSVSSDPNSFRARFTPKNISPPVISCTAHGSMRGET
ncbi:hypothetical protein BC829DRAFT_3843 [Chytridium lagenaria]|nr:hypothetical protein BC829DRAFT_3843 [Chytridium lagenaria]